MRTPKSRFAMLALAAPLACGISYSAQNNKTQPIAGQQTNQNATPSEELQFKLVLMSDGVTKSGASWGGKTYETPNHSKVYLYIVHLDSPEAARKEYEDTLNGAVRTIKKEKIQDKPATKSATTEDRAVIVVSDVRKCNEATAIVATAGRALRIIQSCSAEAALEFEKQANRNEKVNDQYVYR